MISLTMISFNYCYMISFNYCYTEYSRIVKISGQGTEGISPSSMPGY